MMLRVFNVVFVFLGMRRCHVTLYNQHGGNHREDYLTPGGDPGNYTCTQCLISDILRFDVTYSDVTRFEV